MSFGSMRKPRCVGAMATYLNAGLWGSRFVGDCEVSTNGDRVWLKGYRVPAWVAVVRVISFIAFLPVGFYTGIIFGQTMVGRWGYPPYYYLFSMLLTFLLVVLGLWGAGIWAESLGSYESVSWAAAEGRILNHGGGAGGRRSVWLSVNRLVSMNDLVQVQIPVGPHGKPRRLILKASDVEAGSLKLVLAGVYYSQIRSVDPGTDSAGWHDPWRGSRNN